MKYGQLNSICILTFTHGNSLGGGFIFFHPYLGKWSNLTNTFEMGWNHKLVLSSNQIQFVQDYLFWLISGSYCSLTWTFLFGILNEKGCWPKRVLACFCFLAVSQVKLWRLAWLHPVFCPVNHQEFHSLFQDPGNTWGYASTQRPVSFFGVSSSKSLPWKSKTIKIIVPNLGWLKFPTKTIVFGENLFF